MASADSPLASLEAIVVARGAMERSTGISSCLEVSRTERRPEDGARIFCPGLVGVADVSRSLLMLKPEPNREVEPRFAGGVGAGEDGLSLSLSRPLPITVPKRLNPPNLFFFLSSSFTING